MVELWDKVQQGACVNMDNKEAVHCSKCILCLYTILLTEGTVYTVISLVILRGRMR